MLDTQVVYERQPGGDLQYGPVEFVRVGVRFGDRVIWLGAANFPGCDPKAYEKDIALAQEIVRHCKADPTAREHRLRQGVASMLNNLAHDRKVNPDAAPWLDPYVGQANDLLARFSL